MIVFGYDFEINFWFDLNLVVVMSQSYLLLRIVVNSELRGDRLVLMILIKELFFLQI